MSLVPAASPSPRLAHCPNGSRQRLRMADKHAIGDLNERSREAGTGATEHGKPSLFGIDAEAKLRGL